MDDIWHEIVFFPSEHPIQYEIPSFPVSTSWVMVFFPEGHSACY